MVDTSGSIRRPRFEMLKDFLKKILGEQEIRSDRARVGLLTFSDDASVQFQLNTYASKEDVLQVGYPGIIVMNYYWIPLHLKLMCTNSFH